MELQNQLSPAELPLDISKAIAELAKEFMDNSSMKDQAKKERMAKIEKLIQVLDGVIEFEGDEHLFAQSKDLFRQLAKIQSLIAKYFQNLDLTVLANASISEMFEKFIRDNGAEVYVENDLMEYGLVPDGTLTDQIIDVISNVDKHYQQPHQKVAEVLADMYNQFSELNTVVSEMISKGEVNTEKNDIKIDVKKLSDAIKNLEFAFTDPNSSIVQSLRSITFSEADKQKAEELVAGTGLELSGPPAPYYLKIKPNIISNLKNSFTALAQGYPDTNNNSSITVTTYQLQSFQTALDSQGNFLSSCLQTGTEKYRKTISMGDNFSRLVSTFIESNTNANKQFLS